MLLYDLCKYAVDFPAGASDKEPLELDHKED